MIIFDAIQTLFEISLIGAFGLSLVYFMITMIAALGLKSNIQEKKHFQIKEYPSITIQIPTFNELAALNCAERCLAFDYPDDKIQIIIGDDSNDQTISDSIDAFALLHPKIQISRRGRNIGFKPGNLNAMLPESEGDYILILDSDFLPKKDFLKKIVEPVIDNPNLAGVQSSWKIINIHNNFSTLLGGTIVNVVHSILMPFMQKVTGHSIFCGSGELVKKSYLIELGGWTEGSLTEDVDYSLRLIASGKCIHYIKELSIRCEAPYTPNDLFKQQMRWAYGVVRSFILHNKKIFFSKITKTRVKFATLIFATGYVMISLLLFTFIFGFLNILCGALGFDPAASATSSYTIAQFIHDTIINTLLTGGMLISAIVAGIVNGFSFRHLGKLVLALLTIGFVCMFFVGRGIFSACIGLPMNWFMLKKIGNERNA